MDGVLFGQVGPQQRLATWTQDKRRLIAVARGTQSIDVGLVVRVTEHEFDGCLHRGRIRCHGRCPHLKRAAGCSCEIETDFSDIGQPTPEDHLRGRTRSQVPLCTHFLGRLENLGVLHIREHFARSPTGNEFLEQLQELMWRDGCVPSTPVAHSSANVEVAPSRFDERDEVIFDVVFVVSIHKAVDQIVGTTAVDGVHVEQRPGERVFPWLLHARPARLIVAIFRTIRISVHIGLRISRHHDAARES